MAVKCKTCGHKLTAEQDATIDEKGAHHSGCLSGTPPWFWDAEETAEAEAWAEELGLPSPTEQLRNAELWGCPT